MNQTLPDCLHTDILYILFYRERERKRAFIGNINRYTTIYIFHINYSLYEHIQWPNHFRIRNNTTGAQFYGLANSFVRTYPPTYHSHRHTGVKLIVSWKLAHSKKDRTSTFLAHIVCETNRHATMHRHAHQPIESHIMPRTNSSLSRCCICYSMAFVKSYTLTHTHTHFSMCLWCYGWRATGCSLELVLITGI